MTQYEFLPVPLTSIVIHPGDPRLPEPIELSLEVDGDLVSRARVKSGFTSRGIERKMRELPLLQGSLFASLVDPETSLFYQSAYFGALESLSKIEVSTADQFFRRTLMQWSALSHYLKKLGEVARALGVHPAYFYATRDRELLLESMEWFTGHRYGYFSFQVGGVKSPLSRGMLERAVQILQNLKGRVAEYRAFLPEQKAVRSRLDGVGVLSTRHYDERKIGGPVARRTSISGGKVVDALQRLNLWVDEFDEGISNLLSSIESTSYDEKQGEARVGSIPKGEALFQQEGPRGTVGVSLIFEETNRISNAQFFSPSDSLLALLPTALTGVRLEDLELVMRMLDFSAREVDR